MIKLRLKKELQNEPYLRVYGSRQISLESGGETLDAEADLAEILIAHGDFEFVNPASAVVDLPDDFPARELLIKADYRTVAQIHAATDEELLGIDGIGNKTVFAIRSFVPAATDEAAQANQGE